MSFTFNGVNSDDMGLIVEKYPVRPFPERKVNVFNVPGRSGKLIVDQNAFENVIQEYDVYIKGGSVGFQKRASLISKWLLSVSGYAPLSDNYSASDEYRYARFLGGVNFINSLNRYGKATIQFDCKPQRYNYNQAYFIENATSGSLFLPDKPEMFEGKPLITFEQSYAVYLFLSVATPDRNPTNLSIVRHGRSGGTFVDFDNLTVYGDVISYSGSWGDAVIGDSAYVSMTADVATNVEILTRRFTL